MADKIKTEPSSFACPYHGDDLTSQVLRELTDTVAVTSYSIDFQLTTNDNASEFSVFVTCPAKGSKAKKEGTQDETHRMICEGKRVK